MLNWRKFDIDSKRISPFLNHLPPETWSLAPLLPITLAHFAERGGKRWKGKIEIRNHTRYRTFLWNREYLAQQRDKRIVDSRGEECFHYTGDVLYSKSNMTRHAHSRIEDVIHRLKSSMRNEFDKCRREKKKKSRLRLVIATAIPFCLDRYMQEWITNVNYV